MKYDIRDLIEIKEFKQLMREFYNITGIPYGLLDVEGNVIGGIGWQDICTKFHRMGKESRLTCRESDSYMNNNLPMDKPYSIYVCKNGLVESFTPITIDEEHVATLVFGQFFFEKPDEAYFRKQAKKFGFDEEAYIVALKDVPVISKEKVESTMMYFSHLAKMLSSVGLSKAKLLEKERELKKTNEELEKKVLERTEKLKKANDMLQLDIKKRKEIEEKLKKSESGYKNLLELLPYGVCLYRQNVVTFMNSTGAGYFGYKNDGSIIGKRLEELFTPHDEYKGIYERNINKMKRTGVRTLVEEKFIRKCDNEVMYLETISSFVPNKDMKEVLVVFKDISDKKRIQSMYEKIEQKKKKLQEKHEYAKLRTEFFANLSHELRTPVNIIYSAIQVFEKELQMKGETSGKITKRIKTMKQNCNRIIRLISNLIDITKIDSGYLKLDKEKHNIVSIVEDITISVADYVENKNIKLIFDTDSEEKIACVDPNAMERIILNLLSNSVKFTKPDDCIFVNVYDKGSNIAISIKDTGIGIPKDKIDSIFERFRQVDKSLNRNHEGSGIGLSLVKSLVDMHSGKITVNSDYGMGSEFIIEIPRIESEQFESIQEKSEYNQNCYIEKINIEFSDIYS